MRNKSLDGKKFHKKLKSDPERYARHLEYQREYYKKNGRKKHPNVCIVCSSNFMSVRKDRKYCSRKCISTGSNNGRWKGGKYTTSNGYTMVYSPEHPNSYRFHYLEHRLVMEKHLGRELLPTEHIHHKNHDKSDNRLDNLELLTASEHSKLHWREKKHDNSMGHKRKSSPSV